MPSSLRHLRRIVPAFLTVLAIGGALGGTAAGPRGDGPASCRISTARNGDTITLRALAESDRRVGGQYSFRVSGGGRGGGSDIRQGGAFRAAPGRPATLGTVTLSASGASYDVDLELDVEGETVVCTKRIGGGRI